MEKQYYSFNKKTGGTVKCTPFTAAQLYDKYGSSIPFTVVDKIHKIVESPRVLRHTETKTHLFHQHKTNKRGFIRLYKGSALQYQEVTNHILKQIISCIDNYIVFVAD